MEQPDVQNRAIERILGDLLQVNRALHAMFRRFSREHGLTFHQSCLLRVLAGAGKPLSLGEIADEMELAKSTTSVEVDRLVQEGFLTRRYDPECRRRVQIGLTDKGHKLTADGPCIVAGRFSTLFAGVSPADLNRVEKGLTVLARILAESAGQPVVSCAADHVRKGVTE